MSRRLRLLLATLVAATSAATARADVNFPDHYLCYAGGATKVRKSQEAISSHVVDLHDRLGGPRPFKIRRLYTLCNAAGVSGSAIAHPNVHLEGMTIKAPKGTPKFAPVTMTVTDAFATRALVLSAPASFFEVTPAQPGTNIVADFSDDPTKSSVEVNRFECYAATLPKDAPKFVPPPAPAATDDQYPNGQSFVVKKPTRVCLPVDADGATPGAETRDGLLVCYAVKLSKGGKFARQSFGTHARTIGARIVGRRKPAELCVAGH